MESVLVPYQSLALRIAVVSIANDIRNKLDITRRTTVVAIRLTLFIDFRCIL